MVTASQNSGAPSLISGSPSALLLGLKAPFARKMRSSKRKPAAQTVEQEPVANVYPKRSKSVQKKKEQKGAETKRKSKSKKQPGERDVYDMKDYTPVHKNHYKPGARLLLAARFMCVADRSGQEARQSRFGSALQLRAPQRYAFTNT